MLPVLRSALRTPPRHTLNYYYRTRTRTSSRLVRSFSVHDAVAALHPALVPPAIFVGLAVTLWAYKCAMMVVFQNRIIYMPSLPPFSRSETIADYEGLCGPVVWEERRIVADDGTRLALAVGCIPGRKDEETETKRRVVVLYFQGNGSSPPPRLPMLSAVLRSLNSSSSSSTHYTVAALAYRGYWTSRGRPSQPGIQLDARAALDWATTAYPDHDTSIVLWGQSLGAGVATDLLQHTTTTSTTSTTPAKRISGLVLETPFLSIRAMLLALYPHRWLPYRYLSPFLRNHWDSERALLNLSPQPQPSSSSSSTSTPTPPYKSLPVLILSAANDELVPSFHAAALERTCRDVGLCDVRRRDVRGALHNEATLRAEGRDAVVGFLRGKEER